MPAYIIPLAVTLGVQIQASLVVFTPPVLAPKAQFDVGVEAAAVGIITSLVYLTSAPATLLSGRVLQKIGAIRVSQLCVLLTSLGMTLVALASPIFIVLGALIIGLGYGPITPASSAILANTVPKNLRGFIFSVKQSGVPLGGAIAGAVVPGLILYFGWQIAGLIVAFLGVMLVGCINCFQGKIEFIGFQNNVSTTREGFLEPLKMIFGERRLKELALSSGVFSGMQMSLGTFLVVLLTDNANFTITAAGGALSAAMVAGALGRLFWGFISDVFLSPRTVLGLLGLLMSASAFLTSAISESWSLISIYSLAIVFGSSAVGWNGVYLAEVANIVESDKVGTATGGSLAVTYSGVVILPILFWIIYLFTGSYTIPFVFIGFLSLLRGVMFFFPTN